MSNWLVPPKVETPNIIEDIENYCGISREEFERNGEKEKKKLILLAERLEFVEHLSKIRDFFSEKTKKKEKIEGEFILPKNLNKNDFSEEVEPLYVLKAV